MKQQQFEDLLFSGGKRTREQQNKLEEFLLQDESAADLAGSWEAVEEQLKQATLIAPKEGFTTRWLEIELADKRKRERNQAYWALFVSSLAALAIAYYALTNGLDLVYGTTDLFLNSIGQILELNAFLQIMTRLFLNILGKFPPAWWASIATSILLLPALWLVVYRELATSKGVK